MATNTKQKILHTASDLLWSKGYDGASINEVVARAGVSKGGFFHHYPNKQTIVLEVLRDYADAQILTPLDKHLAGADNAMSVKVGLMTWIQEGYGAQAQKGFKGGCMLGNFALELSDKDEVLRESMKQIFLQWENQLVGYLRPVAQEGKLLMEPRQFARMLIAMYEGITMTAKVHKDSNRGGRDFQALAELVERMIRD